ncbi:MAG: methyltransferase domain-containing protein [Actinomycetia bacterium]|nr:methyltransferase domain-containing protein [Actinomycetes bacterium]
MLKSIARILLEPFTKVLRKFFDPRFFKLESGVTKNYAKLDAVAELVWSDSHVATVRDEALRDAITLTNTRVTQMESTLAAQQGYLQDTQTKLDYLLSDVGVIRPAVENLPRSLHMPASPGEINPGDATLLNFSESHRGFRSQAGLWFNPPDIVEYKDGEVSLSAITERSVEIPFVLSAVTSRKSSGSTVLDVGCSESLVPLEFASLGYSVTGIDLREYPLSHPNLQTSAVPLEDWDTDETFDVVVCLSSIEHFGLGQYGEEAANDRLDHRAMRILLDRIEPDGLLVLTIPFGETEETPVQRMYDRDDLDALLEGWVIDTIDVAVPAEQGWVIADEIPDPAPTEDPPVTRQVALITAHPDV